MRFPTDSADARDLAETTSGEPDPDEAARISVAQRVLAANPGDPQLRLRQLAHRLDVDPLGPTALDDARRALRKPTELAVHTAAVQLLADLEWRADHAAVLPARSDA